MSQIHEKISQMDSDQLKQYLKKKQESSIKYQNHIQQYYQNYNKDDEIETQHQRYNSQQQGKYNHNYQYNSLDNRFNSQETLFIKRSNQKKHNNIQKIDKLEYLYYENNLDDEEYQCNNKIIDLNNFVQNHVQQVKDKMKVKMINIKSNLSDIYTNHKVSQQELQSIDIQQHNLTPVKQKNLELNLNLTNSNQHIKSQSNTQRNFKQFDPEILQYVRQKEQDSQIQQIQIMKNHQKNLNLQLEQDQNVNFQSFSQSQEYYQSRLEQLTSNITHNDIHPIYSSKNQFQEIQSIENFDIQRYHQIDSQSLKSLAQSEPQRTNKFLNNENINFIQEQSNQLKIHQNILNAWKQEYDNRKPKKVLNSDIIKTEQIHQLNYSIDNQLLDIEVLLQPQISQDDIQSDINPSQLFKDEQQFNEKKNYQTNSCDCNILDKQNHCQPNIQYDSHKYYYETNLKRQTVKQHVHSHNYPNESYQEEKDIEVNSQNNQQAYSCNNYQIINQSIPQSNELFDNIKQDQEIQSKMETVKQHVHSHNQLNQSDQEVQDIQVNSQSNQQAYSCNNYQIINQSIPQSNNLFDNIKQDQEIQSKMETVKYHVHSQSQLNQSDQEEQDIQVNSQSNQQAYSCDNYQIQNQSIPQSNNLFDNIKYDHQIQLKIETVNQHDHSQSQLNQSDQEEQDIKVSNQIFQQAYSCDNFQIINQSIPQSNNLFDNIKQDQEIQSKMETVKYHVHSQSQLNQSDQEEQDIYVNSQSNQQAYSCDNYQIQNQSIPQSNNSFDNIEYDHQIQLKIETVDQHDHSQSQLIQSDQEVQDIKVSNQNFQQAYSCDKDIENIKQVRKQFSFALQDNKIQIQKNKIINQINLYDNDKTHNILGKDIQNMPQQKKKLANSHIQLYQQDDKLNVLQDHKSDDGFYQHYNIVNENTEFKEQLNKQRDNNNFWINIELTEQYVQSQNQSQQDYQYYNEKVKKQNQILSNKEVKNQNVQQIKNQIDIDNFQNNQLLFQQDLTMNETQQQMNQQDIQQQLNDKLNNYLKNQDMIEIKSCQSINTDFNKIQIEKQQTNIQNIIKIDDDFKKLRQKNIIEQQLHSQKLIRQPNQIQNTQQQLIQRELDFDVQELFDTIVDNIQYLQKNNCDREDYFILRNKLVSLVNEMNDNSKYDQQSDNLQNQLQKLNNKMHSLNYKPDTFAFKIQNSDLQENQLNQNNFKQERDQIDKILSYDFVQDEFDRVKKNRAKNFHNNHHYDYSIIKQDDRNISNKLENQDSRLTNFEFAIMNDFKQIERLKENLLNQFKIQDKLGIKNQQNVNSLSPQRTLRIDKHIEYQKNITMESHQ